MRKIVAVFSKAGFELVDETAISYFAYYLQNPTEQYLRLSCRCMKYGLPVEDEDLLDLKLVKTTGVILIRELNRENKLCNL